MLDRGTGQAAAGAVIGDPGPAGPPTGPDAVDDVAVTLGTTASRTAPERELSTGSLWRPSPFARSVTSSTPRRHQTIMHVTPARRRLDGDLGKPTLTCGFSRRSRPFCPPSDRCYVPELARVRTTQAPAPPPATPCSSSEPAGDANRRDREVFSTGVEGAVDDDGREASAPVNDAQRLWDACAQVLRTQISDAVWLMSFQTAQPISLEDDRLVLARAQLHGPGTHREPLPGPRRSRPRRRRLSGHHHPYRCPS